MIIVYQTKLWGLTPALMWIEWGYLALGRARFVHKVGL